MGDGWHEVADVRRQHLAVALAVGLAIGIALSVATDHWRMIAVGLVLGLCVGLAYHGTGGAGGPEDSPGSGRGPFG